MSCYKKSFEANLPRNSKQPAETMVDGLVQPRWIFFGVRPSSDKQSGAGEPVVQLGKCSTPNAETIRRPPKLIG